MEEAKEETFNPNSKINLSKNKSKLGEEANLIITLDDLLLAEPKNKSFYTSKLCYCIFLYVNPNSGSGVGHTILELAKKENKSLFNNIYEFDINTNDKCLSVKICNILNKESMNMFLPLLKKETLKSNKI